MIRAREDISRPLGRVWKMGVALSQEEVAMPREEDVEASKVEDRALAAGHLEG